MFQTGYFPLTNGYKEAYKNPVTNQFQDGVTFEDIYELYQFDNDLRSIFIKYILMAERNIKSSLSYHFCLVYGDMQNDYLDISHYDYSGKKKIVIQNMLKIMKGQLRSDSDYVYIRHYMMKYKYVPLWVLFNVLTIGQLSKIYGCQKGRVQIQVCQDFGPIKINEMTKMLAVMTKFRNVCAHNDRLFDFRTKDALCDMKIHERLSLLRESGRYMYGKNDLLAQLIILKLLLPEDEFKALFHELKVCFRKHPVTFGTGKVCADDCLELAIPLVFGLTSKQIVDTLRLTRPIFRQTAVFGHFGRKEFPWERTDKAEALRNAVI